MKICCQLPISLPKENYGSYYDLLMQAYTLSKDEETEITIKDVPSGITDPELINYVGFRDANSIEIVKTLIKAEAEGYDAVAGACYFDLGIKASSNLMSIPVVGAAEASMHLACLIGNKFAVITTEPAWINGMEHNLIELGFQPNAITYKPVRSLTTPMDEMLQGVMSGNTDTLVRDFESLSKRCIDDGAEVIIVGCGLISPLFTVTGLQEVDGAPVIDPMIASLKTAEMMAKIAKTGMPIKTKRGFYNAPSNEIRKKGLKDLRMSDG